MMERKMKVADFAALLGVAAKTVYKMIEREEIMTVTEKVNNRATTLVVATDEQISELKKNYSKEQVITGNCCENVTDNNHSIIDAEGYEVVRNNNDTNFASEVIDRIIAINDGYNEQLKEYNERLQRVNDELVTERSKVLLLEDKAGREGLYLNEINGLKTDNEKLKKYIALLITLLVLLLLGLTGYVTYNIAVNNLHSQKETTVNVQSEASTPVSVEN